MKKVSKKPTTKNPVVRERSKHAKPFEKNKYSQKYAIAFDYYSDPKSETFDNAYKSALKAGFPESSAKDITRTQWWKHELAMLEELLPQAEKNIHEILKMSVTQEFKDKETGEVLMSVLDPKLLRIKADMSTFVAETRGRKKYSKKVEVENINPPKIERDEMLDKLFGF